MRVQSGNSHGPKEKIRLFVSRDHSDGDVLFRRLNKDEHTVWECVAAAVNQVEQKDTTEADIKKKCSDS